MFSHRRTATQFNRMSSCLQAISKQRKSSGSFILFLLHFHLFIRHNISCIMIDLNLHGNKYKDMLAKWSKVVSWPKYAQGQQPHVNQQRHVLRIENSLRCCWDVVRKRYCDDSIAWWWWSRTKQKKSISSNRSLVRLRLLISSISFNWICMSIFDEEDRRMSHWWIRVDSYPHTHLCCRWGNHRSNRHSQKRWKPTPNFELSNFYDQQASYPPSPDLWL